MRLASGVGIRDRGRAAGFGLGPRAAGGGPRGSGPGTHPLPRSGTRVNKDRQGGHEVLLSLPRSVCILVCMSTKTIAVDTQVYHRLAGVKKEGESFSKVIDRLLEEVGAAHTGRDILRGLTRIPPLDGRDAEAMLAMVSEDRETEAWEAHDLR